MKPKSSCENREAQMPAVKAAAEKDLSSRLFPDFLFHVLQEANSEALTPDQ